MGVCLPFVKHKTTFVRSTEVNHVGVWAVAKRGQILLLMLGLSRQSVAAWVQRVFGRENLLGFGPFAVEKRV